jgi:hypothetical protein
MSCCATLALLLIAVISPLGVRAQEAPLGGLTQQFSATIATPNFFTNPSQLPQQTGRQSCRIEYVNVGSSGIATPTGYVYFGPTAPVATSSAFELASRQFTDCGSGDGTVDTNAIWIAATATSDLFVFKVK